MAKKKEVLGCADILFVRFYYFKWKSATVSISSIFFFSFSASLSTESGFCLPREWALFCKQLTLHCWQLRQILEIQREENWQSLQGPKNMQYISWWCFILSFALYLVTLSRIHTHTHTQYLIEGHLGIWIIRIYTFYTVLLGRLFG